MENDKFNWSKEPTIGMEIELQLLDAGTLDLADSIMSLMRHYPENHYIKPEFIQCSVEVMSKVCRNIDELDEDLKTLVWDLYQKCDSLGLRICGAGTHPFCERMAAITPLPRYLGIEKNVGFPCYNYITFSIHVHIGVSSGEEMITLMNRLRPYIPVLLALSASSPFWKGYNTGHACYRQSILAGARTYGLPPYFNSWTEFCSFFLAAKKAGIYKNFRDFHWDLRPRPDFGTLEIRIMDAQPTVGEAITLAAFSQALAEHLKLYPEESEENLLRPLPFWVEQENRFRASHYGLEALYLVDESCNNRKLREIVDNVLSFIDKSTLEPRLSNRLKGIEEILSKGPSYTRQRNVYTNTGSYNSVLSSLVSELEREVKDKQIKNMEIKNSLKIEKRI